MRLAFTRKFDKQVGRITNRKLSEEIKSIINEAENATSIKELKNIKKTDRLQISLQHTAWRLQDRTLPE